MDKENKQRFGPNEWLVEDMYRQFQENPRSVTESWREFFEDYRPAKSRAAAAPERQAERAPEERVETKPTATESRAAQGSSADGKPPEDAVPLRGVAARIAENMETSLLVPTATSVRTIPAKLLEENRRVVNRYLRDRRSGKVSFTHIIAWTVLKALKARPAMKASYTEVSGDPYLVQHKNVNLGLAVDVERSGGRTLLVPNIKDAESLDFSSFLAAYEEVIRKVRSNKLAPSDFQDTTVTITNPGTVGTSQSVPRLMSGQGLIVGVGSIGYPTEYEAADERMLAHVAVSKIVTLTSTYDHRVIQGAESGQFLAYIHDLLLGGERFYDEIFASLAVPYDPARWRRDRATADDTDLYLEKQSHVSQLINMHRVRCHMLA
ncbi:hypothetical protein BH18ACT16_BH18ACT16_13600 [soil metagenome]